MKKFLRDIPITRRTEKEALQAIKDLEARGFVVVFPLTEVSRDGKTFSRDSYGRRIFQSNNFTSCWKAVMRKVD